LKPQSAIQLVSLILLVVWGTACSRFAQPTPAPTATLVPLPVDTPTVPPPTATAVVVPPTVTPSPTAVPPTPTATPVPPGGTVRIAFEPGGTSAVVQGTAAPGLPMHYVLGVQAGQAMAVNLTAAQGQAYLVITGANGVLFLADRVHASIWSGTVPTTQDYTIDVRAAGNVQVPFTLQVTVPPLATAGAQTDVPRRITFAPGAITAVVPGTTATAGMDRFVLRAQAGQTMTVNIASPQANVILIIYGADGTVLISDHAGATSWTGKLPATQDYNIDTRSVGNSKVNFTLTVTIPPLVTAVPTPVPTPAAKRITFPAGGTSASAQGTLPVNGMDRYVLRAQAGQTMTVTANASQGQVILIIFGVDGTVLISDHAGTTSWTGRLPLTEDYYIDVRSVGTTAANYAVTFSIPK
jgi:hypothetical protein